MPEVVCFIGAPGEFLCLVRIHGDDLQIAIVFEFYGLHVRFFVS